MPIQAGTGTAAEGGKPVARNPIRHVPLRPGHRATPVLALLVGGGAVAGVVALRLRTQHLYETRLSLANAVGVAGLALLTLIGVIVSSRRALRREHDAVQALRLSEDQYRRLFEQNANPMFVFDRQTLEVLAVNEAAVQQYGYPEDEFLAMTVLDFRAPDEVQIPTGGVGTEVQGMPRRHRTRSGSVIEVEVSGWDVRFQGRDARQVIAVDVTRQRRAAAALQESESRYRDLFENATAPIATLDLEQVITGVNQAFAELLGYTAEQIVGTRIDAYMAASELGVSERELERKLGGDVALTRSEQEFVARSGRPITLEVETRLIYRDGQAVGSQGICRDITAQKRAERELRELAEENRHQATHDGLTGLPNRGCFRDAIAAAIAEGGDLAAVLVIDLDRFKEINDTLGHHYGDLLLQELARSLRRQLRTKDLLGRLGGDEFGILLRAPRREIRAACASTLERIHDLLQRSFPIEGLPLTAEASIGIAYHPADGATADVLLQHADIALYQAKQEAADHAYYRPELDRHDPTRLQLLGELRRALDQDELVLHYQPKLNLRNGRIETVEGLLRWEHPTRGLLLPDDFMELAERTSLIGPLTLRVIDAALGQVDAWRRSGIPLTVAVNVSTRNLGDPRFPDKVAELLHLHRGGDGRLLLEITESALIADPPRATGVLHRLRRHGIELALDDFGRGYTSLAFLGSLPLQHIKIDRSFVTDLIENPQHAAIVRSTISLAHDLDLKVVAEGVETAATEGLLKQFGCDLAQGHYYTPALPAGDLERWLQTRRRVAAVA
jgi:diguanylate cyclase (GGDEF)-like protein/PAS domain S-box-containing protein